MNGNVITRKQQKIIDRAFKDSLNPDTMNTGNYQTLSNGKKVEVIDVRRFV